MDIISTPIDILGVNYYFRAVVSAIGQQLPFDAPRTEMGWEIHEESLEHLLRWLHKTYDLPKILITENGAAMPDQTRQDGRVHDLDRMSYFDGHLRSVLRAIDAGVPMVGYLAWSLLDNFEWALGYEKRFGIVEVVPETLERIPKSSALWFAELAKTNMLPVIPAE